MHVSIESGYYTIFFRMGRTGLGCEFDVEGKQHQPYFREGTRMNLIRTTGRIAAAIVAVMIIGVGGPAMAEAAAAEPIVIADFSRQPDVAPFEGFYAWMAENGWRRGIGDPRYFFIRDGRLHLVGKPGPIYDARYRMALFDREKLLRGLENKVLLRITPEKFRIGAETDPLIQFVFTPLTLPSAEADLRDSGKNDAAFYLLVFFDGTAREFEGYEIPRTVAYVWANRPWSAPVASDPDYADFMRYIAVGFGKAGLGESQTISRKIVEDYRLAFPEHEDIPDITGVGLMIDSNTLGGTAESALTRIQILVPPAPADDPGSSLRSNPPPRRPTF